MSKLIIALMYKDKEILDKTINNLKKIFGEIDLSIEYNFNFTDYYKEEFGDNLKKKIISFKKLINEELVNIKILTNNIEKEFSINNKRTINIDPGYVTLHNIVLASTKDLPHRIYIRKGIYVESTLFFKNKKFNDYSYTFKDYRQKFIKEFFNNVRNLIRNS